MTRVFVVSSLPTVRAGLRALLDGFADLAVVGEAASPAAALGEALAAQAEVVVLEGGPDLLADEAVALAAASEGPRLVLLGPAADERGLAAGLRAQAWGYLPRDASGEELAAAVRAVARGLAVFEPTLAAALYPAVAGPLAAADEAEGEPLTGRERDVLQLVAQGLPNKAIARRLQISEHTVKFHVAAILSKLGAGSRTEAVHLGARRGLVAL
jgi:DNA-binding NarL/FixJ family response regulator